MNAFLTLASTQHALTNDELDANPRMKSVVDAAKAGRVPVHLVASKSPISHHSTNMTDTYRPI